VGTDDSSKACKYGNVADKYPANPIGSLEEAERLYLEAIELYEDLFGEDYIGRLRSMTTLGYTYALMGRCDEAEEIGRRVLEIDMEKQDNRQALNTLYHLACITSKCRRLDRSVEYLRQALDYGLWNVELMTEDEDLAPLRGRADFEEIVAAARMNPHP